MFSKQIEFVTSFEKLIFTGMMQAVESHGLIIREYIVENQLFEEGIDGNGKRLEGYKRTTIRMKIAKGQPADRTTLRDKGLFHASIEVTATPQYFVVSSNVPYDQYLKRKYGNAILKITNENMREFMFKFFIPTLKQYVINKLTT